MSGKNFQSLIYTHYRNHKRNLPWRRTRDPYKILVSEVMLQQTQVAAVLPKYKRFIKKFPDFKSLDHASFRDIFSVWQGLGYNRRPLALKRLAEISVCDFGGALPRSAEELQKLPGVGPATAGAICAFAWGMPVAFLETNIRAVFDRFFGKGRTLADKDILRLVEETLPKDKKVREWYYALMDYGAMLKKGSGVRGKGTVVKRKKARFRGSKREVRGRILKALLGKSYPHPALRAFVGGDRIKFSQALRDLKAEGLVRRRGNLLYL